MPKPTNAELAAQVADLEQKLADATAAPEQSTADETPAVEKPTNVIEAILAVMREVKALGKHERNTTPGQNYNFRGIDATVNALGPAMRKHGLVVIPTLLRKKVRPVQTSQGKAQQASEVNVEYRFFGPGGVTDMVSTIVPGESWDSGDKGVAKAMSVAYRIALLQTFALPTDERDPDSDSYERAHNVDVRALLAEIENALRQEDPSTALRGVWESHTPAVLDLVRVPHPDGGPETITASALIAGHVQAILNAPKPAPAEVMEALEAASTLEDDDEILAALRAMYPRFKEVLHTTTVVFDGVPTIVDTVIRAIFADIQGKQGDAQQDEQAPAQSEAEQASETAHARADEPAEPAQEPVPAQPESEGAVRAAVQTARDDTRHLDAAYKAFYDEIAGQAGVLGVQVGEYVKPLMATNTNATNVYELPKALVHRWISDQRPTVVTALRAQGRATEAAAYEAVPPQAWGNFDHLTGANARSEDPARETADAN